MRSLRAVALAAMLASAGLLSVAAPAHAAAALPDGDALFAFPCDSVSPVQLLSIDPSNAVATPIGTPESSVDCALDAAWDPVTGIAYTITIVDSGLALVSADVTTGDISAQLLVGGDETQNFATLTIDLAGRGWFLSTLSHELFSLDLVTGVLTSAGVVAGLESTFINAFATDPTTGALVALGADGSFVVIDPVALTATPVGAVALPDGVSDAIGLTIDSAGIAWMVLRDSANPNDLTSALWTTPLATPGAPEYVGEFTDATTEEPAYFFALLSTWQPSAPQLAATGVEAVPAVLLTGASAAGVLALAGLVLIASRRRTA